MIKKIVEATIMGIVTLSIGGITIRIFKDNKKKYKKKNYLYFFLVGFLIHFIVEGFGINIMYCDKKKCRRIGDILFDR